LCNGEGFTYGDVNGYYVAKECSCRKKMVEERRLRFAKIPDSFKGMTLQTFRMDVYRLEESKKILRYAVDIIKAYLAEFESEKAKGMGIYLYSDTRGSGKTRLAASLANEIMKNHDTQVRFTVSTSILNEIKKTWDKKADSEYTESQLMDQLYTVPVLIIDDLGVEMPEDKQKDWIAQKFYEIINGRYNNKKITIYTSNYPLKKLRHDSRTINRIEERVYEIPFPEESVRHYLAEQHNEDMFEKIRRN
jgi:DNA replication protein DnaC